MNYFSKFRQVDETNVAYIHKYDGLPKTFSLIFYPTTVGGMPEIIRLLREAQAWCEAQFGPQGERWAVLKETICLRDQADATMFGERWFNPT